MAQLGQELRLVLDAVAEEIAAEHVGRIVSGRLLAIDLWDLWFTMPAKFLRHQDVLHRRAVMRGVSNDLLNLLEKNEPDQELASILRVADQQLFNELSQACAQVWREALRNSTLAARSGANSVS
ncbi:MAG: hypothetical protein ACP5RV_04755 [Thiomonas sp.]